MNLKQEKQLSTAETLFQKNLNYGSIYLDIQNIAAKIYHTGYFAKFASLLQSLQREEADFTLKELNNISEENEVEMDIEREFLSNAIIFKNNLKVILTKLVDDIWESTPESLQVLRAKVLKEPSSEGDILVESADRNKESPWKKSSFSQIESKRISDLIIERKDNRTSQKKGLNVDQPTFKKELPFANDRENIDENKTSAHKDNKIRINDVPDNTNNTLKQKSFTTNRSFVSSNRGTTSELKAKIVEANKIAKLIGEKNKDLDSEFLHKHNGATFGKAKRELRFGLAATTTEGPAPCRNLTQSDAINCIKRNVYNGVSFGKAPKKFFDEEVPRTKTPGPAYKVRTTFLS